MSYSALSPGQKASLGASLVTGDKKNPVFIRKVVQKGSSSNQEVLIINP
jgi:hypothetical protein